MLVSSATTMLRTNMCRSAGTLQPVLFRAAVCPNPTTAGLVVLLPHLSMKSPSHKKPALARPLSTTSKSSRPVLIPIRSQQPPASRRSASSSTTTQPRTDAEADADAAAAAASAQVAAHPDQATLDWNTFFKLRKTRRRLQQAFSMMGALGIGTGGATFLSTGAAEGVVGKMPLDPFVTMGLMTFSCAALGWLVGPVLGTVVFNLSKRQYKAQMAVKESQFFARIKKHRVDPTSSSMNNPG